MLVMRGSTGPVPKEQMMNAPVSKNVPAACEMTLYEYKASYSNATKKLTKVVPLSITSANAEVRHRCET